MEFVWKARGRRAEELLTGDSLTKGDLYSIAVHLREQDNLSIKGKMADEAPVNGIASHKEDQRFPRHFIGSIEVHFLITKSKASLHKQCTAEF